MRRCHRYVRLSNLIGDISTVGEQESLSTIDREDQQYVRMLTYDFRGPTKLANRTLFNDRIEHASARVQRKESPRPVRPET